MSAVPALKIGFVLDDSLDRPDGVQQYVQLMGEWLRGQGHDVHYLVSGTDRQDLPNIHSLTRNIAVRFNGNRLRIPLPARPSRIRALLAREQFDILHVQMPYSPLLAGCIINAVDRRTAVVGTFHIVPQSALVGLASRCLAWWCRRSLRRFDGVVSVSRAAQAFARGVFRMESVVIPNAVQLRKFRGAQPLHRPAAPLLHILFLGRLVPRKGCLLLLQAAEIVKNQPGAPQFHVTVCGRGPLRASLQQFVQRHGLETCVTFAGFITEEAKPHWYASADVTVFPSSGGESFGIVLLEAMASGRTAVLAGDNEGYHGILEACQDAVLFNPADAAELAAKLFALLTDQPLRQRIAAWQDREVEQYDVSRIGTRVLEVYTQALRRRRKLR